MTDLRQNKLALAEQQKNFETLQKLIAAHPNLPVVPMVEYDVVCDDSHLRWMGSLGTARLDKVLYIDGETIRFRGDMSDGELFEELFEDMDVAEMESLTDAEITAKIDALPWMDCIAVNIDLPTFEIPDA